jgi:hypothetical protein
MPVQLPDARSFGGRSNPRPERGIATIRSNRELARAGQQAAAVEAQGWEQAGRAVAGVAEGQLIKRDKERQAEIQDQLATAKSNFLVAKAETEASFENDSDYATFDTRYQKALDEKLTEISATITDEDARKRFNVDIKPSVTQGLLSVRSLAKRKEVDAGRARLNELSDNNVNAALSVDSETANELLGSVHEAIDAGLAKGYLTEQEAQKSRRDVAENFAKRRIGMMPATERLNALGFNGADPDELTQYLPADVRQDMIVKAQRERDTLIREARQEAQIAVQMGFEDELAAASATGQRPGLLSDEVIMRAYPDKGAQMIRKINDAAQFHDVLQASAMTSPEEDIAVLASSQPSGEGFADEQTRLNQYKRAVDVKRTALGIGTENPGDPVAYVLKNSTTIQNAITSGDGNIGSVIPAMIEEQTRLGVPEDRVRVTSDQQINQINERLAAADSAGKVETLIQLEQQYGQYWDKALSELTAGGMDPGMAMVGVVADDPTTATRLATAYDIGDTDLKNGLVTTDVKDMEDQLDDLMADYQLAFASGDFTGQAMAGVNSIRDAAYHLGLQALRRGDDPAKAAQSGFDAMAGNRNIVINDARIKAVLPKTIDGVAVDEDLLVSNLEDSLGDLSQFDIDYSAFPSTQLDGVAPEMRDQIMKQRVDNGLKNGAFWTMDRTGRNMVLMVQLADGSALPVPKKQTTPEGRPVVRNADGTVSTEVTITVTDDRINDGMPTNIPTMFGGRKVSDEEATDIIANNNGIDPETGRALTGYSSIEEPVTAAEQRTETLGSQLGDNPGYISIPILEAQRSGAEKRQEKRQDTLTNIGQSGAM